MMELPAQVEFHHGLLVERSYLLVFLYLLLAVAFYGLLTTMYIFTVQILISMCDIE